MSRYIEYKQTYFGETKVFECNLEWLEGSTPGHRQLIIAYAPKQMARFIGVDFPPGSVSFGYYWEDRNYNVYHWKDASGKTMLYYFNISKGTEIENSCVRWVDLIVDVALKPGAQPLVLDEDEIPAQITAADLTIIKRTKNELLSNLTLLTPELEKRTAELLRKKWKM